MGTLTIASIMQHEPELLGQTVVVIGGTNYSSAAGRFT
jgi:hypothetical protein